MTAWPCASYCAADFGRLAQLVRALPSHGRGQRFKSFVAHHLLPSGILSPILAGFQKSLAPLCLIGGCTNRSFRGKAHSNSLSSALYLDSDLSPISTRGPIANTGQELSMAAANPI